MHSFETIDQGGIASLIILVIIAFGKFNSSIFAAIFLNFSTLRFIFSLLVIALLVDSIDQLLENDDSS